MRTVTRIASILLVFASAGALAQDAVRVEIRDSPELMEESTRERIQERLATIAEPLRACLRERETAMNFGVTVNRDGAVTQISGDAASEEARCARSQLQRLRFDPLSATVTFPVVVAPRSATLPTTGRPTIRTGMAAVHGSLSRDVIRRVIRQNIRRVRHCYERALQQDPNLTGRITVRFVIAANGAIQTASATSNTLGDPAVASCVVQVVRTMRFPAPAGGGIVVVNYPFMFNTGTGPGMTHSRSHGGNQRLPESQRVANGRPAVTGTLARQEILRVIRRDQNAVRYCYERELQQDASLSGRITIQFEIAPSGRVSTARATSNTLNNTNVASCIVRRVQRWVFPQPQGGSVNVSYPFVFSPG